MATSAFDIAAALRQELNVSGLVQLNKLLYYAQGWHLAWFDEPLFPEQIQAFKMGPVVAEVSRAERDEVEVESDLTALDDRAWAVVRFVASKYGRATGATLTRSSHNEPPWIDARNRAAVNNDEHSTEPISPEAIRTYFKTREGQDQAWFWSRQWQDHVNESLAELSQKPHHEAMSIDDFLASL